MASSQRPAPFPATTLPSFKVWLMLPGVPVYPPSLHCNHPPLAPESITTSSSETEARENGPKRHDTRSINSRQHLFPNLLRTLHLTLTCAAVHIVIQLPRSSTRIQSYPHTHTSKSRSTTQPFPAHLAEHCPSIHSTCINHFNNP